MADDLILSLGLSTQPALTQLDRDLSAFEKRRPLKLSLDGSSINSANKSLQDFDRTFSNVEKRFVSFAAVSTIIYGTVRAIDEMARATIRVNSELARINLSLNTSNSQLQALGKNLFNIAKDTGSTFDEAAKIANQFAQQGLSAVETAKRTSDALKLIRVSGIDANDAVEVLTNTTKVFNKESLDSSDIINRLSSLQGKYAVTTKTLAEAVQKSGESANEAGVSFNQLLAIVTNVAQTTQKDGNTIAVALNTIFSNERKSTTLDVLRNLGIQAEKLPGQLLPSIEILKNISTQYDKLSDAQRSQLIQVLGGSRQSAVLLAILKDLNKEYGTTKAALDTVNHATDEANQKNAALNQTLEAQVNAFKVNLEKIGSSVGTLTLAPVLKTLLGGFNTAASADVGQKIGAGILSGIGQALNGPGLVVGGLLIAKLFGNVGKLVVGEFTGLLKQNSAATQQKEVQLQINNALKQQGISYEQLNSLGNKRISQEEFVLNLIKQQTAAQIGREAVSASLASSVISKGGSSFSGGYLPNAIGGESAAISQNVGGAFGASPVVVPNFSVGGVPQTVVANSKEYLVPTKSINPSYSGPDHTSILNPEMVSALGGLPAGARPVFSKGFVPHFDGGYVDPSFSQQFQGTNGGDISGIIALLGLGIAGGLGATVLNEFRGSSKSGELNFRSGFGAGDGGLSVKDQIDKRDFLAGSSPFPNFQSEEYGDVPDNLPSLSPAQYNKGLRAAELRKIKGLGLIGSNRVKSRKKRGLANEAKRLGLSVDGLNKFEIANLINLNKITDSDDLAISGLFHRGFSLGNDVDNNFNVLRKVGIRANGFIPNYAFGSTNNLSPLHRINNPNARFGEQINEGFQSTIYDAGKYVFKARKPGAAGASQHSTLRGLQFLQGLINQDSNLQALGIQAGVPVKAPSILQNLFSDQKGFFQEKVSNFRYADDMEALTVRESIEQAVKNRGANSKKGFTSFNLHDLSRTNILIDGNGRPVVTDLLSKKSEGYRQILRGKRGFADGLIPFQPPNGYTLDTENPSTLKDFTAYINENGLRTLERNLITDPMHGVKSIGPVTINRDGQEYIYDPSSNNSNSSVAQNIAPPSVVTQATSGSPVFHQLKAAGASGINPRYKDATNIAKAAARGVNIGSGGLPPNIPIAPPAPSAPTPPSGGGNNFQPLKQVLPNISKGANNIPQFFIDQAKKSGLVIKSNDTVESLQHAFGLLKKQNFDIPDSIFDYSGASALESARKSGVGSSFNVSDVNLLNNSASGALPILNNKGQIAPEVRRRVNTRLQELNQTRKNPLNPAELDQLTNDIITKRLDSFISEADKQISNVRLDKSKLSAGLKTLQGKSDEVAQQSIKSQVEQAISTATNLSPDLEKNYRKQIRAELYSNIDPRSRKRKDVRNIVDEITNQKISDVNSLIGTGQNNIARTNNETNFISGLQDRVGRFGFGNLTNKKGQAFSNDYIEEQVRLGGNREEITAKVGGLVQNARRDQISRRSNAGLGAAFIAPILAGEVSSFVGQDTSLGRNISGVTNSLSTGGSIAAVGGGSPPALIVGGIVASLGIFKTALDNVGPSLEEANKAYQKGIEKISKNQDQLSNFAQASQHVQDVIQAGGSPAQIARASAIRDQAFLAVDDPKVRSEVAGKTPDQIADIKDKNDLDGIKETSRLALSQNLSDIDRRGGIGAKEGGFGLSRSAAQFLDKYHLNTIIKYAGLGIAAPFVKTPEFSNPFERVEGQNLLKNSIGNFEEQGVRSTDFTRSGISKLKSILSSKEFDSFSQATDKELEMLKKQAEAYEKNIKPGEDLIHTLDQTGEAFTNFNKLASSALNEAVFQKTFKAKGDFNTQQNNIDLFSGLVGAQSDKFSAGNLLGFQDIAARASISNNARLQTTQALGSGLDQLGGIFSNKETDAGSKSFVNFGANLIKNISSGKLTGTDALSGLTSLRDQLKGTSNEDLLNKVNDLIQNSNQKLEEISQNTDAATKKQDAIIAIENKRLAFESSKNFAGGIGTFTNPGSFSEISNPISAGLTTSLNRINLNRPLNQLGVRQQFDTSTELGRLSLQESRNNTNAGFERTNLGFTQSLLKYAGDDKDLRDDVLGYTGGVNGTTITDPLSRLTSGILGQRKNDLSGVGLNALNHLDTIKNLGTNDFPRLQRELRSGAQNLDLGVVRNDLSGIYKNASPQSKKEIEQVQNELNLLDKILKKAPESSRTQAEIELKGGGLASAEKALQDAITKASTDDQASMTLLIDSNTLLQTKIDELTKVQNDYLGLLKSDKNPVKVDVDQTVKVVVDIVEKAQGALKLDLNKIKDIVAQAIKDGVKPEAQQTPPPKTN